MQNKIYRTFDEAVADIPDGSVFMSPGFGGVGLPRNCPPALGVSAYHATSWLPCTVRAPKT